MGFHKFCGAAACIVALALTGCQATDNSAQRLTAQGQTPAGETRQGLRGAYFRQEMGVNGRLGPVTMRSSVHSEPGLVVVSGALPIGSDQARVNLALPVMQGVSPSHMPEAMLDRARAVGARREDLYWELNHRRLNESETAAVFSATALLGVGRWADAISWLFDAALQDGGSNNALMLSQYIRHAARAGLSSPNSSADLQLRARFDEAIDFAAAMLANGIALVVVDGSKCADDSAARNRTDNYLAIYAVFLREIGAFAPERRARIKRVALALELATATSRAPDPTICRAGDREAADAVARSWAAGMSADAPELAGRRRVGADGRPFVLVPATPERPDMYRPPSEFPAAVARAREQARQLLDRLIP